MSREDTKILKHLGFGRWRPSARLSPFVDWYWAINTYCERKEGFTEFLHPDGGMGLIFNYGDTLQLREQSKTQNVFLDGTNTHSVSLKLNSRIDAIGIRFKPAGAFPFMPISLVEIKNSVESCDVTQMSHMRQLYHVLPEMNGMGKKIAMIEQVLLSCYNDQHSVAKSTQRAIEIIRYAGGVISVENIATRVGVNLRCLERQFRNQMGMSASEYAKSIRIRRARELLKQDSNRISDVALALDYFDQAHFTKQFKSVVGITPGDYRKVLQI